MYVALFFYSLVAGALGRRFGGGLLSQWLGRDIGDFPVRILQAFMMASIVYMAGAGWPATGATAVAVWFGAVTCGFYGSMGATSLRDAVFLVVYGIEANGPLAAAAFFAGYPLWWLILLAGVLRSPLYFAARVMPLNVPKLGCLTHDFPPTAELATGALFGVATAVCALVR
jgi:hypothetical protein